MPINKYSPTGTFATVLLVTRTPVHDMEETKFVTVDIDGEEGEISEKDLQQRGVTLGDHQAGSIHAIRHFPKGEGIFRFEADWENGTVELEGYPEPMTVDEFRKRAVRTTEDGTIACAMFEQAHVQIERLKEKGGYDLHSMDIRSMVEAERAKSYSPEVGMYDIQMSEMTDDLTPMQAMAQAAKGANVDGSHPVLSQLTPQWMPITSHPHWYMPAVRQTYRDFLAPYLAGADISDTVLTMLRNEDAALEVFGKTARRETLIEPFTNDNLMKGYRTTVPTFFEYDNMCVVVFTDVAGSYAYAWQPEIKPTFARKADEVVTPMWDKFFPAEVVEEAVERKLEEKAEERPAAVERRAAPKKRPEEPAEDEWSPW
jgi:hypothetical protein